MEFKNKQVYIDQVLDVANYLKRFEVMSIATNKNCNYLLKLKTQNQL